MSNHRWSKFVWSDWSREPGLRLCTLAARGLWMELLCIAHEAIPRGHVLINGRKPSNGELARMLHCAEKPVDNEGGIDPVSVDHHAIMRLLSELRRNGVCDVIEGGIIVSRRMVRDEETHQRAVKIGKLGGNPNVSGTKEVNPKVNGSVNPTVNRRVKTDSDSESKNPSGFLDKSPPKSPKASASTPSGALRPRGTSEKAEAKRVAVLEQRLAKFHAKSPEEKARALAIVTAAAEQAQAELAAAIARGEVEPVHPFRPRLVVGGKR